MKNLGNINATHLAIILNDKGEQIGTCIDTPNNAAYALFINSEAMEVKTPFNKTWSRKNLETRFAGLDASYHSQFIIFN